MVTVVAPPGVLYNVVEQPKSGQLIVHLLNYTARPVTDVHVTVQEDLTGAEAATRISCSNMRVS